METINHECYVSPEIAKLLKKVGFDWMCSSLYGMDVRHKGISIDEDEEYELKSSGRVDEIEYIDCGAVYDFYNNNKDPYCYSRPTLDVAQRWLREVKDIYIMVFKDFTTIDGWHYFVVKKEDWESGNESNFYQQDSNNHTYEEAQQNGIQKALELILEKEE